MKRTPEEIMERMDALLDEYEAATDKFDRGAFADKYGERLGQYSDKLKSLNGDDFDIIGAAYDEHKKDYSDLSDDDYVNALEENIKKVISRIWPETTPEDAQMAAEAVADEMKGTDLPDETTSDENTKQRTTGHWGNPSTSGGRTGKCGIIKGGKNSDGTATSDEDCKTQPLNGNNSNIPKWKRDGINPASIGVSISDEDCKKGLDDDDVKKAAEAVADPAATIVKEVVTAKPKEVKGSELEEAYTFSTDDPLYKRSH